MDRRDWNTSEEEPRYTRRVAARLAQISLEFLNQCERENLIQLQMMRGGGRGLSVRDIRRLERIRRLQDDLELELPAIEIVLRMRRRTIELLRQMDEMERLMEKREEELLAEIRTLQRRIAEEYPWKNNG
jgi:DNA-binding transcriptional MerR regulator